MTMTTGPLRTFKNKFIKQSFVCYAIKLDSILQFDYHLLSTGNFGDPCIYDLTINRTVIPDVRTIQVYTNPLKLNFYGRSDTHFEQNRGIYNATTKQNSESVLVLTYHQFYTERLPHPYKTNCLDYKPLGMESSNKCHTRSFRKAMLGMLGKLPFDIVIRNPSEDVLMTNQDAANKTFMRVFNENTDHY